MRNTFNVDECKVCISIEQSAVVFAFAVSSFVDSCVVMASEGGRLIATALRPTVSGV